MRPFRSLLLLTAALSCSCATPRRLDPVEASAPLEFVAFLCADACRVELAGADPLPYHAGAPATRIDGDHYEVRYEQRGDGRWTPRADGRLLAELHPDGRLPQAARWRPAPGLIGWRSPHAEIVVHIERHAGGTLVRTVVHGAELQALEHHLQDCARYAAELDVAADTAVRPCCARHAPWTAVTWVRRADDAVQAGDLPAARDALRAALAQAPRLAALELQIGALDRALGQDQLAARRLRSASLRTFDPATRTAAALAGAASAHRRAVAPGPTLRQDATTALAAGDLETALALAHAARATDPDPLADLRLRHRLLRSREDTLGSLGTALLLREYAAGDPEIDRLLAEDFARAGNWQLARRAGSRLLLQQLPLDMVDELRAAGRELASRAVGAAPADRATPAAPPK